MAELLLLPHAPSHRTPQPERGHPLLQSSSRACFPVQREVRQSVRSIHQVPRTALRLAEDKSLEGRQLGLQAGEQKFLLRKLYFKPRQLFSLCGKLFLFGRQSAHYFGLHQGSMGGYVRKPSYRQSVQFPCSVEYIFVVWHAQKGGENRMKNVLTMILLKTISLLLMGLAYALLRRSYRTWLR